MIFCQLSFSYEVIGSLSAKIIIYFKICKILRPKSYIFVNFESQKVWKRIINKRIVSLLDLLFKRIKQETEFIVNSVFFVVSGPDTI